MVRRAPEMLDYRDVVTMAPNEAADLLCEAWRNGRLGEGLSVAAALCYVPLSREYLYDAKVNQLRKCDGQFRAEKAAPDRVRPAREKQ